MKYRRLTAGLLLLVMLVSLTACSTSEADLIGKWRADCGIYEGEKVYFPYDFVWVFRENGEGELEGSVEGEWLHADFTWTLEDETLLMRMTSFEGNTEAEYGGTVRYKVVRLTSSELTVEGVINGMTLQIVFTR